MTVHVRVIGIPTRRWWHSVSVVRIAAAGRWVFLRRRTTTWWAIALLTGIIIVAARRRSPTTIVIATRAVPTRRAATIVIVVVRRRRAVTAAPKARRARAIALTRTRNVGLRLELKLVICSHFEPWGVATVSPCLTSEIQRTVEPLKSLLSSFSTAVARSAAVSYSTKLGIVSH